MLDEGSSSTRPAGGRGVRDLAVHHGDRGLVDEKLDPDLVRKVRRWIAAGPLIVPLAVALAFVKPFLSLLIYLALPALFVLFNPVDRYLERLRQGER